MNIFISHSHADKEIAKSLAEFVLTSLEINNDALRCTSVPGFQLPFGTTISEQLKDDINSSFAVFVIITKASLKSNWVLFELGASWALGKIVVPILCPPITPNNLPGPLRNYPCVQIDSPDAASRIHDAILQIVKEFNIKEVTGGRRQGKLDEFINIAKSQQNDSSQLSIAQAMAFELTWLIMSVLGKMEEHPEVVYPQIEYYMSKLELKCKNPIESYFPKDDDGTAAMKLIFELGGLLKVKHPELINMFEAGVNLLEAVGRNKKKSFIKIVNTLPLPEELKNTNTNHTKWAHDIHRYFNNILINTDVIE